MKVTTRVDIFVATDQSFTDFIHDLSDLLTFDLTPMDGGNAYQFSNGAIVLTVQSNAYASLDAYRYHLLVTGGVYGVPTQRVKWIVDWSLDFYQALKATGRYRLRWVDDVTNLA